MNDFIIVPNRSWARIAINLLLWLHSMIDPGQAHQLRHLLMVGDVGSAPLDGPNASAHFPDAAALRAAVMASKVHDDTMRFDDKFLSCMPVARMKSTPPLSPDDRAAFVASIIMQSATAPC